MTIYYSFMSYNYWLSKYENEIREFYSYWEAYNYAKLHLLDFEGEIFRGNP